MKTGRLFDPARGLEIVGTFVGIGLLNSVREHLLDPRVFGLATCLMSRELRSLRFWVTIGVSLGAIILEFSLVTATVDASWAGVASAMAARIIAVPFSAIYAAMIAADVTEDRRSGLLELLSLADVSPGLWIASRMGLLIVVHMTFVLIRLPLNILSYDLGGVPIQTFVAFEAVLAVFTFCSGLAAFTVTPLVRTWQAALTLVLMTIVSIEALCYVPRLLATQFPVFDGVADVAGSLSIVNAALVGHPRWSVDPTWFLAAHGMLAVLLIVTALRSIAPSFGQSPDFDGPAEIASRQSHRVPDDALAWLAGVYHLRSTMPRNQKLLGWVQYGVFAAVAVLLPNWRMPMLGTIVTLMSLGLCLIPTVCLQYEITHQTLPSLAVLPTGGRGLYEAWLRGAALHRRSTSLIVVLPMAIAVWLSPLEALCWPPLILLLGFAAPPVAFASTLKSQEKTTGSAIRRGIVSAVIGLTAVHAGVAVALLIGGIYALIMRRSALAQIDDLVDQTASRM